MVNYGQISGVNQQLIERLRARRDELGSLQSSYWAILRNRKLINRNELIIAISRRNIASANIRIENELDRLRGRNLCDVFGGDVY